MTTLSVIIPALNEEDGIADIIERVLAVARGEAVACEITGGRRVRRSGQRFDIESSDR